MELVVELFFVLMSWLFSKGYRARHPELLGRSAEELSLEFAKLQLIHKGRALKFVAFSPLPPLLVVGVGFFSNLDIVPFILASCLLWVFLLISVWIFLIPLLKFQAIAEPSQNELQEYFEKNKENVVALALNDPEVKTAQKRVGKVINRIVMKSIQTRLYSEFSA